MKIVNFTSTRFDGQMNTKKEFYPEGMELDTRIKIMNENKQALMDKMGLSYKDIFITIQKNSGNPDKYEDGLSYTLTKEDVQKYEDLFDYDVYADIAKITPETMNVAVAFPSADCAVVQAINIKTNEITLAHCGGEYIDRYLPMQTIDALGGNEKDIRIYISPFAYTLFYEDEVNLKWANNDKVWKDCKTYSNTGNTTSVKVDIYKALKRQLLERKIDENNIFMSPYDITTSDLFFSHSKGKKDEKYKGRILSGMALIDDSKKVEETPYIKIIK